VGFRGTDSVSYEAAVTAVLIEGAIFLVLALTGARYAIIKLIPEPVKAATPAAIGAFLAHLGLQTAEGIGAVVSDIATAVTLGGCPVDKRTPIVALTPDCAANSAFCVLSDAYTCDNLGGQMSSATVWMGILGLFIISILLAYRYVLLVLYYCCWLVRADMCRFSLFLYVLTHSFAFSSFFSITATTGSALPFLLVLDSSLC
jgi:AGZA family xanthine/uracil permease-like MFS transporter